MRKLFLVVLAALAVAAPAVAAARPLPPRGDRFGWPTLALVLGGMPLAIALALFRRRLRAAAAPPTPRMEAS